MGFCYGVYGIVAGIFLLATKMTIVMVLGAIMIAAGIALTTLEFVEKNKQVQRLTETLAQTIDNNCEIARQNIDLLEDQVRLIGESVEMRAHIESLERHIENHHATRGKNTHELPEISKPEKPSMVAHS